MNAASDDISAGDRPPWGKPSTPGFGRERQVPAVFPRAHHVAIVVKLHPWQGGES